MSARTGHPVAGRRHRLLAVAVTLCLLALPRGEWPGMPTIPAPSTWHDMAWRATSWLESWRIERTALPAAAREELLREPDVSGSRQRLVPEAVQRWQQAAGDSLQQPLPVGLPYAETMSLHGDEHVLTGAGVQTWTVQLPPDGRLLVITRREQGSLGGLVVDVLDPARTGADGPAMIGSFGPQPLQRRFTVPPDASARPDAERVRTLLVRVQATPGAFGRFSILLDARPALDFPVDTDADSPVRSRFGVARDGGRRSHHGIDIFADRGTAVLAAADGVVVRIGDSARGGLHVWQRAIDEDGARLGSLYYAHLERIDVQPGDRVERGEQLGTVGNTGNARTTPPHLHLGLYRRFSGPVDPLPLTGESRRRVPDAPVESALPRWSSVLPRQANLRTSPDTTRAPLATLAAGELVRIDSLLAGGRWVRVRAGGQRQGWMVRSLLGPSVPGDPSMVQGTLHAGPSPDAPQLALLPGGTTVTPLGRFGTSSRVSTAEGLVGWLHGDRDEPGDRDPGGNPGGSGDEPAS